MTDLPRSASPVSIAPETIRAAVERLLADLRARRPLVHAITNYVSMDLAANALLALGASPAMVHAAEEVEEFVALSDALVVNIGTLSPPWIEAMIAAAARARTLGKPWVLDPVGAGATTLRDTAIRRLLAEGPSVVRGNASEILAVAGLAGAGRGVDSGNSTEEAREAADRLALAHDCVVVATGAFDYVTDGHRAAALGGGDGLVTKVTATGCALSAAVAAFAGVAEDPLEASFAACAVWKVAARHAADLAAGGPATFRTAFVDHLARLGSATVARSVEVWP